MTQNADHISAKTRERAMVLAENAKKMGLNPGNIRFNSRWDFMSFWFTNGLKYIIVFCSPSGYLAEVHTEQGDEVKANYLGIKNIRNFLFAIRKEGLESFDKYHAELAELADLDESEVKDIVEQFLDEEDED